MSKADTAKKTGPRDVFTQLAMIIALYVSVISFGALIFQYINIFFPDALSGQLGRSARRSLRWPLSVLVIVFPLYVWLSAFIQKDLLKFPAKRELKTRKWMLYFTLFLTAIVIVIDLVTLIFRFLGGELTIRFLLKVLAVFLIALAVFVYYTWNIKKAVPATRHPLMKLFVWGVTGVAGLAIAAGFFVTGSPQAERLKRFDERRVSDLQAIQFQITDFWQAKGVLPQSLADLKDDIRGFVPPVDPENGTPYEYSVTDDTSFELCATFNSSNKDQPNKPVRPAAAPFGPFGFSGSWDHSEGRTCFERTIDPDRFPPLKKLD